MTGTFQEAAQRWFCLPKVVGGLARFVIKPGAAPLLPHSVRWLAEAAGTFDDEDWRERDLEENLVVVLAACWERESRVVSGDPAVREAFLSLLTRLASRGGHAAAALRDRVLDSIGGKD
jgi:hypothetical protein